MMRSHSPRRLPRSSPDISGRASMAASSCSFSRSISGMRRQLNMLRISTSMASGCRSSTSGRHRSSQESTCSGGSNASRIPASFSTTRSTPSMSSAPP